MVLKGSFFLHKYSVCFGQDTLIFVCRIMIIVLFNLYLQLVCFVRSKYCPLMGRPPLSVCLSV